MVVAKVCTTFDSSTVQIPQVFELQFLALTLSQETFHISTANSLLVFNGNCARILCSVLKKS